MKCWVKLPNIILSNTVDIFGQAFNHPVFDANFKPLLGLCTFRWSMCKTNIKWEVLYGTFCFLVFVDYIVFSGCGHTHIFECHCHMVCVCVCVCVRVCVCVCPSKQIY